MSCQAILINGYPGTGKTTLLRKLTADLDLPGIGKDAIKEMLSDELQAEDGEWSFILGFVSAQSLQFLFEQAMAKDKPIILENAFINRFAEPELNKIVQKYDVKLLEIYCTTTTDERLRRVKKRRTDGARHRIHGNDGLHFSEDELAERYAPLHIGELISVDTSDFKECDYQKLLQQIRETKTCKEMTNDAS